MLCANRYDRGAVPLFYQSTDETYKSLHAIAAGTQVPVTGAHNVKRGYNPSAERLRPCAACRRRVTTGSTRGECIFEFQLVPHLISVLRSVSVSAPGLGAGSKKAVETEGDRNGNENGKEGVGAKEKGVERTGMEWGTVLVFTCADNCCAGRVGDPTAKECWQEELVLVQWEE
jgi:pre-rRNA-processing protein TSR4